MTPKALTPGQQTQFNRFVEDGARKALNEVVLDNEGLQMLLENGGEFHEDIVASIHRLSRTNQYASEENPCQIGYSSGYRMKPISEQVAILRGYFPNLGGADERVIGGQLPGIMEGWFAIPRWQKIGDSYSEAFEKLLSVIGSTRKFHNYREGQLGPDRLRQLGRSMKIFQEVCEEQKGMDIIIVPAQFGKRHGGRSSRRAREVCIGREFGLGGFGSGGMLLTHPERLTAYVDLFIDAPGDEYAPDAGGSFSEAPCWGFSHGELEFVTVGVAGACGDYGSASACPPGVSP